MIRPKKCLVLVVFLMGSLFFATHSRAQFLGNPVALSGGKTMALGVSGVDQNFQWTAVSFRSKGIMARFSLGLVDALDIYLLGGYRDLQLNEKKLGLSDVEFGYDGIGGTGFRVRILGTGNSRLALHGFMEGVYFRPQTYFEQSVSGRPFGTVQRSYVYLEGYSLQGGAIGIARWRHFDLFVGTAATSFHFQTKQRDYLISTGEAHLRSDRRSVQQTPIQALFSVGFDWKLPDGYRIGLEVQNATLPDFRVMVGISQIGHGKN